MEISFIIFNSRVFLFKKSKTKWDKWIGNKKKQMMKKFIHNKKERKQRMERNKDKDTTTKNNAMDSATEATGNTTSTPAKPATQATTTTPLHPASFDKRYVIFGLCLKVFVSSCSLGWVSNIFLITSPHSPPPPLHHDQLWYTLINHGDRG